MRGDKSLERLKLECGLISEDDLQHYDPRNDWDTQFSAFSIFVAPEDMASISPSIVDNDPNDYNSDADIIVDTGDDGNYRERSREIRGKPGEWNRAGEEERRGMNRHIRDDDDWGSTYEDIPRLGINPEYTGSKVCTKCGLRKRFKFFYAAPRNEDKLSSWCKQCQKASIKHSRDNRRVKTTEIPVQGDKSQIPIAEPFPDDGGENCKPFF